MNEENLIDQSGTAQDDSVPVLEKPEFLAFSVANSLMEGKILAAIKPRNLGGWGRCPECATEDFQHTSTCGAPAEIETLKTSTELLPLDSYSMLEIEDRIVIFELAEVLNNNGLSSWTVCPACRVDDFTDMEGCEAEL